MKKLFIALVIIGLQINGYAQDRYSAYQSVYDLGLISLADPFLANRNSALLLGMRQYQVGFNIAFKQPMQTMISVSGPIQHNLGIGITWDRSGENSIIRTENSLAQFEKYDNRATLSLGHNLAAKANLGHQIIIGNLSQNDRMLWDKTAATSEILSYEIDQLTFSYRIGLFYDFCEQVKLALLTPSIFEYIYMETRTAQFETRVDKKVIFWGEKSWQANTPEVAIEFLPDRNLSAVTALGKENDRIFFHYGVKSTILNRFILAGGFDLKHDSERQITLGFGTYIGGFNGFYSFNFNEKLHQITLSFSPLQERELIKLVELKQNYEDIFLYKLAYYSKNEFICADIQNLINENVNINLELSGAAIHRVNHCYTLSPGSRKQFRFNLPQVKGADFHSPAYCQFRISAFSRGKQVLERSIPLSIRDIHQWNGELEDLIYFIQTDHRTIFNLARKISQNLLPNSDVLQYAEAVFNYLSQNLKYLKDPTLHETDYVQFPYETLFQKSGDCEDLCLLYCSLLGALGIQTALVEINFPEKSEDAHIFVLVNTSLKPEHFNFVQSNPNRYVFRENVEGDFKAWIPVELTLVGESFEKAWEKAAEQYYQYAILKGGLAQGWVKILDVF